MKNFSRKLIDRTALTLTELLVSSMLMGVVMVGAASYGATIKRMYDTSDKHTIIAMQGAMAMGHIERHLQMASGYRITAQPNYSYLRNLANPTSYWSFRTDPGNTHADPTDDFWAIIYKYNPPAANQYDLYACFQADGVGPGQGPIPDDLLAPCGANRQVLLKNRVQAFTMDRIVNTSPTVLDFHVDVDLIVSLNPASGLDDPLDDPTFRTSTRIPMTSHAWTLLP